MTVALVDEYYSPTYKHLIERSVVHYVGNGKFLFQRKNLAIMSPFTGRRLRKPDNLGKCGLFVRVGRLPFGFVRDSMPGLGQSPCRQGVVVIT